MGTEEREWGADNLGWKERPKSASRAKGLTGPWEMVLHELSNRQALSQRKSQDAAGRSSMHPLSLSAGMGNSPFNPPDSHCRGGDPVSESFHDTQDWIHATNGWWVDVSTLRRSLTLAHSAYSSKPATTECPLREGLCGRETAMPCRLSTITALCCDKPH